jgi:hypothetical protein
VNLGEVIDLAGAVVVLLAVLGAVAALVATRQREVALAVLLDLLTAAGLLHLAADPGFMRAASAATVLLVRRLINWSLAGAGRRQMKADSSMTNAKPTSDTAVSISDHDLNV